MRCWRWLALGGVLGLSFLGVTNSYIIARNRDRFYAELARVPSADVALVLGTSPLTRGGQKNLHFHYRIESAAALYHAGKVRHILVSGDNRRANYNEPTRMKEALAARGVPGSAITCDYAGFRTLDSVVRARQIFDVQNCIIVTQRYHATRALEIARARGLRAVSFCTRDVALRHSLKTEVREVLARTVTVLDLYVWHRQPRFLGKREPIVIANLPGGANPR
jgi:SanA protein